MTNITDITNYFTEPHPTPSRRDLWRNEWRERRVRKDWDIDRPRPPATGLILYYQQENRHDFCVTISMKKTSSVARPKRPKPPPVVTRPLPSLAPIVPIAGIAHARLRGMSNPTKWLEKRDQRFDLTKPELNSARTGQIRIIAATLRLGSEARAFWAHVAIAENLQCSR